MAKLKALVKKYSNDTTFDYDTFYENNGIEKNDEVKIKDVLIAFDEATESLERCYKRSEPKTENYIFPAIVVGLVFMLFKK